MIIDVVTTACVCKRDIKIHLGLMSCDCQKKPMMRLKGTKTSKIRGAKASKRVPKWDQKQVLRQTMAEAKNVTLFWGLITHE